MMRRTSTLLALTALAVGCIGKDSEPDRLDLAACSEPDIICTIAGNGDAGYNSQEMQALDTALNRPTALGFAPDGRLLIDDTLNYLIRRLESDGVLSTVAGKVNATYAQPGPALDSPLKLISDMARGPGSMIYLAESEGPRVIGMDMSGAEAEIVIYAGKAGLYGHDPDDPDVPASETLLDRINGIAVDDSGIVYMAIGLSNENYGVIRAFDPLDDAAGVWTIFGVDEDGYLNGSLADPQKLVFHNGDLYVADAGLHGILRLDGGSWEPTWVAGGVTVDEDGEATGNPGYSGDDGPWSEVVFNTPYSVIFTSDGRMIVSDSGRRARFWVS